MAQNTPEIAATILQTGRQQEQLKSISRTSLLLVWGLSDLGLVHTFFLQSIIVTGNCVLYRMAHVIYTMC